MKDLIKIDATDITKIDAIATDDGVLHLTKKDGDCFMQVANASTIKYGYWQQIPQYLYDALIKFQGGVACLSN